jgi:hypothetical protein
MENIVKISDSIVRIRNLQTTREIFRTVTISTAKPKLTVGDLTSREACGNLETLFFQLPFKKLLTNEGKKAIVSNHQKKHVCDQSEALKY